MSVSYIVYLSRYYLSILCLLCNSHSLLISNYCGRGIHSCCWKYTADTQCSVPLFWYTFQSRDPNKTKKIIRNYYRDTQIVVALTDSVPLASGLAVLNTLRPGQNGRNFADDIFKCIFLNENVWIPIKILLKFVPKGPINNIPALVQILAWRRPGDKPLFEPMLVRLPTHICVTRLQWVNSTASGKYDNNFKSIVSKFIIQNNSLHEYVIKWKHFPSYWSFLREIHWSPMDSLSQRPVTRRFDVFFDLHLHRCLSKHVIWDAIAPIMTSV